ncbi:hypothetical protein G9A89_008445 [Geosiphon pyriformis]|nr:hypothetical protein G9A89_008445 [Geosiphon pyriformis]
MHPADLQAAVTNARNFEAAELKANHVQAVNLVMNRLSELDSKLKQFKDASLYNWKPNQHKSLTSNISPVTITNDKLLATIFLFEFKEITPVLLFSKAVLDTKLITVMYTDVKIDDYITKLILDSGSAGNIIT